MSTTQTTISDGSKTSSSAQWSVLPDDLLGMIRSRVASPHDRARLSAVCKSWRAAASDNAVPLLLLSPREHGMVKHLCGPQGYWDFRTPSRAANRKIVGTHNGGWVAAVGDDYKLVIMNIFSGKEGMLSGKHIMNYSVENIEKIIFSEAPTTRSCIVAVMAHKGFKVAVCKIDCPKSGWATKGWQNKSVADITFCNGELYGLMNPGGKLMKFKIAVKETGGSVITNTYEMAIQGSIGSTSVFDPMKRVDYIFELRGKPAVAVWTLWVPEHEPFFKVFKLDDAETGHMWTEVTSFGNYALFLGPKGSKTVQVLAAGGHHGPKRNHIYYTNPTFSRPNMLSDHLVYSVKSEDGDHMLCKEKQNIGDGVGRTAYYLMGEDRSALWLQHADF